MMHERPIERPPLPTPEVVSTELDSIKNQTREIAELARACNNRLYNWRTKVLGADHGEVAQSSPVGDNQSNTADDCGQLHEIRYQLEYINTVLNELSRVVESIERI